MLCGLWHSSVWCSKVVALPSALREFLIWSSSFILYFSTASWLASCRISLLTRLMRPQHTSQIQLPHFPTPRSATRKFTGKVRTTRSRSLRRKWSSKIRFLWCFTETTTKIEGSRNLRIKSCAPIFALGQRCKVKLTYLSPSNIPVGSMLNRVSSTVRPFQGNCWFILIFCLPQTYRIMCLF